MNEVAAAAAGLMLAAVEVTAVAEDDHAMTPLAWTLIGLVIVAAIAFPFALVAIARHMGARPSADAPATSDTTQPEPRP